MGIRTSQTTGQFPFIVSITVYWQRHGRYNTFCQIHNIIWLWIITKKTLSTLPGRVRLPAPPLRHDFSNWSGKECEMFLSRLGWMTSDSQTRESATVDTGEDRTRNLAITVQTLHQLITSIDKTDGLGSQCPTLLEQVGYQHLNKKSQVLLIFWGHKNPLNSVISTFTFSYLIGGPPTSGGSKKIPSVWNSWSITKRLDLSLWNFEFTVLHLLLQYFNRTQLPSNIWNCSNTKPELPLLDLCLSFFRSPLWSVRGRIRAVTLSYCMIPGNRELTFSVRVAMFVYKLCLTCTEVAVIA